MTGKEQKRDRKASGQNAFEPKKANCVKVPKIHWDLTRKAVLTMEWIDGIKLTDESGLRKASLNRRKLIDQVTHNRLFLLAVIQILVSVVYIFSWCCSLNSFGEFNIVNGLNSSTYDVT